MKKVIAISSIGLSLGFAMALVNADDTRVSSTTESSTTQKTSSTPSSCTDENGVTHKKGEKSFASCLKMSEKTQKKTHQMGGQTDENFSNEDMNAPNDRISEGNTSVENSRNG